jgi:hypothetical protein
VVILVLAFLLGSALYAILGQRIGL